LPKATAFIAGDIPTYSQPSTAADWFVSAYPVVDAAAPDLAAYAGQRVILVGKLFDSVSGVTRHGLPYLFLGLGGATQTMRIVLWSEILGKGKARGWVPPSAGSHVSVTGVLTTFHGSPQIVLEELALLKKVAPADRSRLLGFTAVDRPTAPTARWTCCTSKATRCAPFLRPRASP
jgi:hypothetical protein